MDKKISELDQALQINNDAVFPISQDNGGTDTTYKVSITQISAEVGEDQTFSNLDTTDKTLVGAINEIAQGGSGTTDYEDLSNKPQVNSVELVGDKSLDDLGIMPASLSKTVSGSIAHITDGGDNIPVKSLVSQIVSVESGNGQPKSPTNPYTISGFANGIIASLGANLWSSGNVTFTGATSEVSISLSPKTYYFSAIITTNDTDANTCSLVVYYTDNTYLAVSGLARNERIFTSFTATKAVAKIEFYSSDNYAHGSGDTATWSDILISENGNDYTFAFGQTVYGGHFDNKGNLVVTHGIYIFTGSEGWTKQQSFAKYYSNNYILSGLAKLPPTNNQSVPIKTAIGDYNLDYANLHSKTYSIAMATDGRIGITEDLYSGVGTLEDVWLYYELATPITLAITSQDIPTLLGENNIFSNTGDIEVEYYTNKANDIAELIRALM